MILTFRYIPFDLLNKVIDYLGERKNFSGCITYTNLILLFLPSKIY